MSVDPLSRIDLQAKARPTLGRIEAYWFENEHVGLTLTRFHRIELPFEPFDSGLDWVEQPEETSLTVDWIHLDLEDPSALDGIQLANGKPEGLEATIDIGAAHHWVQLHELRLSHLDGARYEVELRATVEFETEGVGQNELFAFRTEATYAGELGIS